jgi:predicted dehydrogenase/threonine dehydrogenase-like Zn-dependent dehydrogenase
MKQILQNLKTGELEIAEAPAPKALPGQLLIRTRCTLISSGTERMLVSFAKSGLISKARQQPDKVKQVIDKIKSDGLLPTLHSVFARLDEPLPLGYCNCGEVIEVGPGVEGFAVGDRVANNGPHAEFVSVPKNLCAKVPDNVTDEEAAFTVLAAIGLQGIRLIAPAMGETVAVFGLGLIGLVGVQLLRNSGCRVLGIDLDPNKLNMARKYGAEIIDVPAGADPIQTARAYTGGKGVDAVLITASAKEDSIVHQAAQMSRKRGRIVLIGVVNLNLDRADFYEKELTFQVSCSYGPGRYDPAYENSGQDYPFGYVRWTEQRNFEAILAALADKKLDVASLISERIPLAEAHKAYQILTDDPAKMALLLTCPKEAGSPEGMIKMPAPVRQPAQGTQAVIGLIGAGNFAKLSLLPVIQSADARFKTVADVNGAAAAYAAKKFGFEQAANDYHQILSDPDVNTVIITTRHDLHAPMVIESLKAGKHVAVEKPLCLNRDDLAKIRQAHQDAVDRFLMVGFNRRFSPHAVKMRQLLAAQTGPMCLNVMINAGEIPPDIWLHNLKIGGGRIIGEGCHWMDLMVYLTGSLITTVSAAMLGQSPGVAVRNDKMSIILTFSDGSVGTLNYFANGHKSYPKETVEVFCDGKILRLDNFRKLRGYGWPNFGKMNLFNQDKGHKQEYRLFLDRIARGGEPPIPFEQIENVTLASFAAVESAGGAGMIAL